MDMFAAVGGLGRRRPPSLWGGARAAAWSLTVLAGWCASSVARADVTLDVGGLSIPPGKATVGIQGPAGAASVTGRSTLALKDGVYSVTAPAGPTLGSMTVQAGDVVAVSGGLRRNRTGHVEVDINGLTPVTLNAGALTEPAGAASLQLITEGGGRVGPVSGARDVTYFLPDSTYSVVTQAQLATYGTFAVDHRVTTQFTGHLLEVAPTTVGFNLSSLARVTMPQFSSPPGLLAVRIADSEGIAMFPANTGTIYLPTGRYRVLSTDAARTYGTFDVTGNTISAAGGGLVTRRGALNKRLCGLATVAVTVPPHAFLNGMGGAFSGTAVLSLPPGRYTVMTNTGQLSATFEVTSPRRMDVGAVLPGTTIVPEPCTVDASRVSAGGKSRTGSWLDTGPEDSTCSQGSGPTAAQCPSALALPRASERGAPVSLRDEDVDGDGVPDVQDNCVVVANTSQADADWDGYGDPCDADDDADGVRDTADNCPLTYNPGQFDFDGDGQGDACDGDSDGDGVLNALDQCPATGGAQRTGRDGCSGAEAVARMCTHRNSGSQAGYVSCVAREASRMVGRGLMAPAEQDRLVSGAARPK